MNKKVDELIDILAQGGQDCYDRDDEKCLEDAIRQGDALAKDFSQEDWAVLASQMPIKQPPRTRYNKVRARMINKIVEREDLKVARIKNYAMLKVAIDNVSGEALTQIIEKTFKLIRTEESDKMFSLIYTTPDIIERLTGHNCWRRLKNLCEKRLISSAITDEDARNQQLEDLQNFKRQFKTKEQYV